MLTWMGALLALAAALGVMLSAARLPYAPECPDCRAMTAVRPVRHALDRLWALAEATPVRHCARCGWSGRMRWRMALQRVPGS